MDAATNQYQGDILIVDDTVANLRVLSEMLESEGYEVRAVPQGKMALTVAQAAAPDLVLLDINMPDMNGFDVCRELKKDERTKDIPVIFISASDDQQSKVQAFDEGGVDYITKPFQIGEVAARVKTHLTIQRLNNEMRKMSSEFEKLDSMTKCNTWT